ncbi:hypothetical protein BT93_C2146 [Corymbia citriodora subsp. variegata]|nr:hypothetical protein BT93_C2146 [Corymbia citriodora subsp. variegata]
MDASTSVTGTNTTSSCPSYPLSKPSLPRPRGSRIGHRVEGLLILLGEDRALMEDEKVPKGEEMMQDFRGAIGEPGLPYRYDVFLSFRGVDTRNGFTDHLHAALDQRGIAAFMDEEELREGEEIAPAILGAIGESRISIVVFSENYASSGWCLDELVRILECRDTMRQIVWPVFYKVDPSEVRNQTGRYGQALIHREERLKSKGGDPEKVKRWREALTTAANISGWHLADERESNVIQSIIKRVWAQLDHEKLHVPENVVAMDSHVNYMHTLLHMESNEVHMVGICGLGGIGKTTIAKATYNALAHKFECCSFLFNVRETSEKSAEGGLLELQKALVSQVMSDDDLNIHRGTDIIKSRLCRKKVLIVIDDVNRSIQLETLVGGRDWFGHGSRIIITTRDERLLAVHGVDSIYKVQPLDSSTADMLFRSIVFQNSRPPPEYQDLSYKIVGYTNGLPLAIKVLGHFLKGRSLLEWKSALDKLKRVFNGDIFSVLRTSFDGLDEHEKDIFLDIACFFKGWRISYAEKVLESCHLDLDIGIAVLKEKSLITIEHGMLEMHDMIQEMGREIVRQESPKEPGERSRLWSYEDVIHVLTEGTGTNKVEAIMLALAAPEEVCFSAQAFTNMKRLRLFRVHNVYHSGDPIYFPAKLRWLEWPNCSLQSMPFNTGQKELVHLDMSNSSIRELGKGFKLFRNLKSVNFSRCTLLSEIPDVSSLPNLESLDLRECTNLVEVHQSLGGLAKVVYLNFFDCCNLSRFPSSLNSSSLIELELSGCSKLSRFPDILKQAEHLEKLKLHQTAIEELPSSVAKFIKLKLLDLMACPNLKNLPCSIYTLQDLRKILIRRCPQLSKLPKCVQGSSDHTNFYPRLALPSLHHLFLGGCSLSELKILKNLNCTSSMTILSLSGNKIVRLPTCIGQFTKLYLLSLDNCKQLREIPALPPRLAKLSARGCESLESCPYLSHMSQYNGFKEYKYMNFYFQGCHKLVEDQCSINCNALSIEGLLGPYPYAVNIIHPGSKMPKWREAIPSQIAVWRWKKVAPPVSHCSLDRQPVGSLGTSAIQMETELQSFHDEDECNSLAGPQSTRFSSTGEAIPCLSPLISSSTLRSARVLMPWDFSDPDVNKVLLGLFDEVLWKNEEMMLDYWGAFGEFGRPYIYDVFLTLRGENTRSSFAGHLHAALKQRGIAVFMDDEELGKGEEIALAILRAIGELRISIVVLSRTTRPLAGAWMSW